MAKSHHSKQFFLTYITNNIRFRSLNLIFINMHIDINIYIYILAILS